MLPYAARMQDALKEYFVLNKPRDIVSGDYYWLQKHKDTILLAVIDCVGHGVPGALMSMIAHAVLDKVIILQAQHEPAEILAKLHEEVKFALQANTDSSQGGMDMAILTWQASQDTETKLTFGGAKRPLFVKRPQTEEVEEIQGTRRSVGGEINLQIPFEQHTITVEKGTMVYMFTDGITDQNNEKRSRIGSAKLKIVLNEHTNEAMTLQKEALEDMLASQMQNTVQRDDILLIGVRF